MSMSGVAMALFSAAPWTEETSAKRSLRISKSDSQISTPAMESSTAEKLMA
jgi:hypothetical protein